MTFVWKKATDKFYARNWAKAINVIRELNTYFNERNVDIHYSILKKPNFLYLLKITDKLEDYIKAKGIRFAHGKGKRKTELQRLYEHCILYTSDAADDERDVDCGELDICT